MRSAALLFLSGVVIAVTAPERTLALGGPILRLHLAGFGKPLSAAIDQGPCRQGRTLINITSMAGAHLGSVTLCVLTISKTERNGLISHIDQTVSAVYRLPGGTILTRENQTIRFARDQRHTTAVFLGHVTDGTGRYTHATGTVSGGGNGVNGKADWLVKIRLRQ